MGAQWLRPPGPVASGLRIGLLGGSFNPPHEGHVHITDMALKRLGLDYVWWLVSPQNPLKSPAPSLDRRLALASKLVHERRIIVTDVERRLGTRFTFETLAALSRRFPSVQFVWLMGSDNLASFHRWKNWERILDLVPAAVVVRPGSSLAPLKAKAMWRLKRGQGLQPRTILVLDGPRCAQSSTRLRDGTLVATRALC